MSLKVVLPLPPNRANDRSHWRKVHREKKAYYELATFQLLLQSDYGRRVRAEGGDYFNVTATLYVKAKMDDDNAVARLKWPLDTLVNNGLLFSDKRPWCTLTGIPEQQIDRKHPRVEIVIDVQEDFS